MSGMVGLPNEGSSVLGDCEKTITTGGAGVEGERLVLAGPKKTVAPNAAWIVIETTEVMARMLSLPVRAHVSLENTDAR